MLFDIGANRGDAVVAGLQKGHKVIALEAAPRIFRQLVSNFIYNPDVIPLRFAVAEEDNQIMEFYECVEDGLSTLNKEWLTNESFPYAGKEFRTVQVTTMTLDTLISDYGLPELIKIDVEGAEDSVLAGYTKRASQLCFEWSEVTVPQHVKQLMRLKEVNGYTEYALQYITHHLEEPTEYRSLDKAEYLPNWIKETTQWWTSEGWKESGLRPTADVGMLWVR